MGKITKAFLDKFINAVKIPMELGEIQFTIRDTNRGVAYTYVQPGKRADIYLNFNHPLFNTPNMDLNNRNLIGVTLHEMLHKKYTDPSFEELALGRHAIRCRKLFHDINNILEDFTIESRCILSLVINPRISKLLRTGTGIDLCLINPVRCLDSAILTSWKMSPAINEADDILNQIIPAMIQFTDMGPLVPGSKLKDEIKDEVRQIYSELIDAIFEDPAQRIERAIRIYDILEKYCSKDESRTGIGTKGVNKSARGKLSKDDLDKLEKDPRVAAKKKILKRISESMDKDSKKSSSPDDSEEGKEDTEKKAGKPDSSSEKDSEDTPDKTDAEKSSESSSDKEDRSPDERKESDDKSSSKKDEASSEKGDSDDSEPDDSEEDSGDSDDRTDDKDAEDDEDDFGDDCDPDESEAPDEDAEDGYDGEEPDDETESDPEDDDSDGESRGKTPVSDSEEEGDSDEEKPSDDADEEKDESDTDAASADKSTPDGTPMERKPDLGEDEDPFVCDDLDLETIKSEEEIISKEKIEVSESVNVEHADFSKKEDTERLAVERDVIPAYTASIQCKNFTVTGVSEATMEAYNAALNNNRAAVSRFTKTLTNLAHEPEHSERSLTGRLNRESYAFKRHTSLRIFDKVTQKDRTNARIVIALDVSGSMSGNKIYKAKEALACIVEGLTNAGIPVKVMTFCDDGHSVIHHHYVNYHTGKAERSSIMQIEAGGDNFDGYSIRYALKEVVKLKTRNRLLMVISDGAPLTRMVSNPTQDAINAIKEAKRRTKVIGIGIDANKDILRRMYTDTFVELDNIESLMSTLCKIVLKEVQKWQ